LSIGFYTNWAGQDDASWPSLKRSLKYLDWVVPGWMELSGPGLDFDTRMDQRALDFIRTNKPGVAILPMIQNASSGNFDGPGLARLLADRTRADKLLNQL